MSKETFTYEATIRLRVRAEDAVRALDEARRIAADIKGCHYYDTEDERVRVAVGMLRKVA